MQSRISVIAAASVACALFLTGCASASASKPLASPSKSTSSQSAAPVDATADACKAFNEWADALQANADGSTLSMLAAKAAGEFVLIGSLDPDYSRFANALQVAASRDGIFDDLTAFQDLVTLCL